MRATLRSSHALQAWVAICGLLFVMSTGLLGVTLYRTGAQAHQNRETLRQLGTTLVALCAQRKDTDAQIANDKKQLRQSRKYLREHPHGIPGILAALIRQGIQTKQQRLAARIAFRHNLNALDCPHRE